MPKYVYMLVQVKKNYPQSEEQVIFISKSKKRTFKYLDNFIISKALSSSQESVRSFVTISKLCLDMNAIDEIIPSGLVVAETGYSKDCVYKLNTTDLYQTLLDDANF